MKKRVLSLLLALTLCFSMSPTEALAEEAGAAQEMQDIGDTGEAYATGGDTEQPDGKNGNVSDGNADGSGKTQNGGADTDVSAVQALIDALSAVRKAPSTESGVHTDHCVCGGTEDVNGHTHDTSAAWTAADALPESAGNYYLTQSVTSDWTAPQGNVTLCLNGQTITGNITVGTGAELTLTDCNGSGQVQGGVTINGGTFELYGGTITGGVQVGQNGNSATGSSFTMYGGVISGHNAASGSGGGVFLVGTTNQTAPPSFTMHGGTISNNTAGASDGGGGGVYVGEKCSFTMDGGTITGNTATNGNGGGIYIHYNAGTVAISNATITNNKATATGDVKYGLGGGIYSQKSLTVSSSKITGNKAVYYGGGICGAVSIKLDSTMVTGNSATMSNGGGVYASKMSSTSVTNQPLSVSGSTQIRNNAPNDYYVNEGRQLPINVTGTLTNDAVIGISVLDIMKPGYGKTLTIAEPASGVTLNKANFKTDAGDCETGVDDNGKVYLALCGHIMDDTGYTCSKCQTQFDARVGEDAYYQTIVEAFNAAYNSTVMLLRDVTLNANCSANSGMTLDLNGKTISSADKRITVVNVSRDLTLTIRDSGTNSGTQPLNVKFNVSTKGKLAVDDSYTGDIQCVELQAGGALERFGGKIGELILSPAASSSTSTDHDLMLWKDNTHACTIDKLTDNTAKNLTVSHLLEKNHAKCELYGEKDGAWSAVGKDTKLAELTGCTAYKVQFPECVHQCSDDTAANPVCSKCSKKLYTKITARTAEGTITTAYFAEDSALENGYVEAVQTLNSWSNAGSTEPTLTLLQDMPYGATLPLSGTLTLEGGTYTAKNVTIVEGANVTFASGSYKGATINGTATVKNGVTFTDNATVTVNGTLNAEGGTFDGNVKFENNSTANISGGNFTRGRVYGGVQFSNSSVTGTISGGTFTYASFNYTTKVKLTGGTFGEIQISPSTETLASLLAEGAAYYQGDSAVSNDAVTKLNNVTVRFHEHNGGTDDSGVCSICQKQMTASLTVGGKTSWYAAFATAIDAANAADGTKVIRLYQNVDGYDNGKSTTYELTRGPVTLATGTKTVTRVGLNAKGISLTITGAGSGGSFNVTADGEGAEVKVSDGQTKLSYLTAQNGGKLSLSNGTFSGVEVKDDGSSASLSGGSYAKITGSTGYVAPYALLAKGYGYKKQSNNSWSNNATHDLSDVTVEKAPIAVEKVYPDEKSDAVGSSANTTDGNIQLTVVVTPETENATYQWELLSNSNNWVTSAYFHNVNNATHTGHDSKTLSINGLTVDGSSYQYRVLVKSSDGYECYSEPFTVTAQAHAHAWEYKADGGTITAACSNADDCPNPNGGSVTIKAPTDLTYNGSKKPATLENHLPNDVKIPEINYTKGSGPDNNLPAGDVPTSAGEYTASITVGGATASVDYTIAKAAPKASDFTFTAPSSLTYDGNAKTVTVAEMSGIKGMGSVTAKYYQDEKEVKEPVNAGDYTFKIDVAEGNNYTAADGLTNDEWMFTIARNDTPPTVEWSGNKTYTYTGEQITPEVTVKVGDTILVKDTDYTIAYGANTTAGKDAGKVTIQAKGNYGFTDVVKNFDIEKADPKLSFKESTVAKTYIDKPFSNLLTQAGNGTVTYKSSDSTVAKVDENGNVTIAGVGKTTITATVPATTNYKEGSAYYTLTVNKARIHVDGVPMVNDKTYDGTTDAYVSVFFADENNETVPLAAGKDYTITGRFRSKNAGMHYVDVEIAFSEACAEKYELTGNIGVPFATISPKPIRIASAIAENRTYKKDDTYVTITSVSFYDENNQPYTTLRNGLDYTVFGNVDNADAGTGKEVDVTVTLTEEAAGNYALSDNKTTTTVNINKATAEITAASQTLVKNGKPVDISEWASTNNTDNAALTYTLAGTPAGITLNGNMLTAAKDTTVKTFHIKVTADATTNFTAPEEQIITVEVVDKIFVDVDGEGMLGNKSIVTYGDPDFSMTAAFKDNGTVPAEGDNGTWSWSSDDDNILEIQPSEDGKTAKIHVKNVGTAHLKVTYTSDTYIGSADMSITVNPKEVTADMIADIPAQEYAAEYIEPTPEVTDGTTKLTSGTDFTYSYANNRDAGTATLTITGNGNYTGTASKDFTISKKSINGATIVLDAKSLPYTGSEQTVSINSVTLEGWSDAILYKIVGGAKAIDATDSITLRISGRGNYTGTATTTWKITRIDPKLEDFFVSPDLAAAQTYDGEAKDVAVTAKTGIRGMGDVTVKYDGSTEAPTNAGSYKVTLEVADGMNYNAKTFNIGTLTINKAAAPALKDMEEGYKYSLTGVKTVDLAGLMAGATGYKLGVITGDTDIILDPSVDANGILKYTLTGKGKIGNTVTLPVTITSDNYEDTTVKVVITLTAKDAQAPLSITGGNTVVYGKTLTLGTTGGSGTGKVTYSIDKDNSTGEAAIDADGVLTPVKAGKVTIIATKAGDADYDETTSAAFVITITKAGSTGGPKYTVITAEGKTLADAGLTLTGSTLQPADGKLEWIDDAGNGLSDDTKVEANKTYQWRFTPANDNYEILTGEVELWHVDAPAISAQPKDVSVITGEKATFEVTATGTDVTYQWQIDRNDGKGFADITGANSASYITGVTDKGCDGFQYQCVIRNAAGSVTTAAVTLTVTDKTAPTPTPNPYQIIEGANGSWSQSTDGNGSLRIRGDGAFSKFREVKVDGNIVDPVYYRVTEGSTIIEFRPEYLKTLSEGIHTFEMFWTDGSASTSFTIAKNTSGSEDPGNKDTGSEDTGNNDTGNNNAGNNNDTGSDNTAQTPAKSPKTGDASGLWIALFMASAAGLAVMLVVRRKKQ